MISTINVLLKSMANPLFNFRLDPETNNRVKQIAAVQNTNSSEVMRRALKQYLDAPKMEEPPRAA